MYSILICANLLPIGTYFCVLGLLHAAGRPFVTTGVRDFVALALALVGVAVPAMSQPLDHLLRSSLLPQSQAASWWFSAGLYFVLIASLAPRGYETLVVYNCSEANLVTATRTLLHRLGVNHREVPGGWLLSDQGMSLEIDAFAALSNVSLHFRGLRDPALYRQMHAELAAALGTIRVPPSLAGFLMVPAGGLILAVTVLMLARDPQGLGTLVRQVIETW